MPSKSESKQQEIAEEWLRTKEGRKFLATEVDRTLEMQGVDVLLVLESDGYLEAYSWPFVRVVCRNSIEDESKLPLRSQKLYWPKATRDGPGKIGQARIDDGKFLTARIRRERLAAFETASQLVIADLLDSEVRCLNEVW